MNKTLVIIAVSALAFVGCKQRDNTMNESAGAEKSRVEAQKDAQQEQLDAQKREINAQAKSQKEAIEAQSDAQKAQLDAQKKQLEAEAKAQKAQAEAQEKTADAQAKAQEKSADAQQDAARAQAKANEKINESAGAEKTTTTTTSDTDLESNVRRTLFGDTTNENVTIKVKDGKVTLTGTVKSQEEKDQWEQKAKSVSGVSSVDNELKVQ